MSARAQALLGLDRGIHEPARLALLTVLSGATRTDFLSLLKETGLTKGNLSFHLARLERRGYVFVEKTYRGKIPHTICHLTEEGWVAWRSYQERLKSVFENTVAAGPSLT